ncbi:MAG TPA: hypothetical protein VL588_07950 [Bdellovibrionota bacterium]|jgi:hypothetical protein|nr:hypothetical protein [Bdellovibrionota bacterium]
MIDRQIVARLARIRNGLLMSVYCPCADGQGRWRLQYLMETALSDQSTLSMFGERKIRRRFDRLFEVARIGALWRYPAQGLAFFVGPGKAEFFRCERNLPWLAYLSNHFFLGPLADLEPDLEDQTEGRRDGILLSHDLGIIPVPADRSLKQLQRRIQEERPIYPFLHDVTGP